MCMYVCVCEYIRMFVCGLNTDVDYISISASAF